MTLTADAGGAVTRGMLHRCSRSPLMASPSGVAGARLAAAFGNSLHTAATHDASLVFLQRPIAIRVGIVIFPLDEEPVVAFGIARPTAAKAHEVPATFQPFPFQNEGQITAGVLSLGIADRL